MRAFIAAPVLHVSSMEQSVAFYTEKLGFTERFRYGGEYTVLEYAGEVQMHLSTTNNRTPAGNGQVYIICDTVDEYYAEITDRGVVTLAAPADWPYGMRDFELADPDGNLLAFGAEIKE